MKRNLITLSIFLIIALAIIFMRPTAQNGNAGQPTDVAKPSQAGEFRGICLQFHNAEGDFETLIDEISQTGANTVCLVIHAFQENGASSAIFVDGRKTPSDRRLLEVIQRAHQKKLRVMLMPVVLLAKHRGNEWRGKIEPDDWDEWWSDYNKIILHYAQVAQKGKIAIFSVGSELLSTETQMDRWQGLIKKVRNIYDGRLTYSSNWDHYQVIKFWDDLDIVGMTTYYTLAKGENPSMETLMDSWKPIKKRILDWQKTVDRPILFTEVGWPNQVTCAEFPWNYYKATDSPDPELQSMCFESFFKTWGQTKEVTGYLMWEWKYTPNQYINADGKKIDPDKDTGYCLAGKSAMKVITRNFLKPSPWQTATSASQPASGPASQPADSQ